MLRPVIRHLLGAAVIAAILTVTAGPVLAAVQAVGLFTVVTEKDENVVTRTAEDTTLGDDAEAISKALPDRGSLTLWHCAVRTATGGELEQTPREKISLRAQGVRRIEAYRPPLRVVATAE